MKNNRYIALCAMFLTSNCFADTTTTTTVNPDGSTTVVETSTTPAPPPAAAPVGTAPKLIGPKGVTGTIRRSDRRQDRRLEEDLEDLSDAVDRRPSTQHNSVNRVNRR